jgi:hypothetical protein
MIGYPRQSAAHNIAGNVSRQALRNRPIAPNRSDDADYDSLFPQPANAPLHLRVFIVAVAGEYWFEVVDGAAEHLFDHTG